MVESVAAGKVKKLDNAVFLVVALAVVWFAGIAASLFIFWLSGIVAALVFLAFSQLIDFLLVYIIAYEPGMFRRKPWLILGFIGCNWAMVLVESLTDNKFRIKKSRSYIVFLIVNTLLMIAAGFVFIGPYLNVMAQAFNVGSDTALGGVWLWPRQWTIENIMVVLGHEDFIQSLLVSVARVISGSFLQLIITYFAAYAFLRKGLRGRKIILLFLIIPMFFNAGLLPTFIFYSDIGLRNNFLVYILPFGFNFFNMAIIRTYLMGIPISLRESARIDGASEFKILFKIMFPLSMPIIATILLWNAVFHWNDWTTTLYFIGAGRRDLFTLQYNLQMVINQADRIGELINAAIAAGRPIGDISHLIPGESIIAAQLIVTTLPIILVYPFLQKYFIQGVMIGSVKE